MVSVGDGGFKFDLATVTIHIGDTVQWNWSASGHTSTSGTSGQPSGFWDSGFLNTGGTFSHLFNAAGSFPYFCTAHGACCGMVGTVTVAAGTPTPTPTPSATPAGRSQNISTRVDVEGGDHAAIAGFIITGGYTPPAGARKHFGALLVGYYEKKKLLFAGKVGTGFDTKMLAALHRRFEKEKRADCPFADLPSKQNGVWVQGITPGMMRKCHWVNPVFVAQVKFAEWTRDAKLRQPVFLGLREDKDPREVRREIA
jgi:hypothetical protein